MGNEAVYTVVEDGLLLRVYVQPGAKVSAFVGTQKVADGEVRLKIRLQEKAVDGQANAALLNFLATTLLLPKSSISLKSGQRSRLKTLHLKGVAGALTSKVAAAIAALQASEN